MKMLLRLCSAAALVAVVTACGEMPTATDSEIAPARRNGVFIGGGHISADSDTTTVNTVSSDGTTTSGTGCLEERGGVFIGGGHLVDDPAC